MTLILKVHTIIQKVQKEKYVFTLKIFNEILANSPLKLYIKSVCPFFEECKSGSLLRVIFIKFIKLKHVREKS